MTKNKSNEILELLIKVIPNPVCELDFSNNFELICAVLLSAQTIDKRVNVVTKKLFSLYPTPLALMNASFDDVYNIIESLGFAKTKTTHLIELSKMIHEKYSDVVPSDFEKLIELPGVGKKTASVVQAVGFNIPAMPVDTHLHRMAYRLGYIEKSDSVDKAEAAFKKYIPKEQWIDAHHLLLLFGRYYCKAKTPCCHGCLLKNYCRK